MFFPKENEIPKYHETFLPILAVLSNSEALSTRDLVKKVREQNYTELPEELLSQETSTGTNRLYDRITWGKSYLKMGKLVEYPQRGMVKITEKGGATLKRGQFTLSDLQTDTDFIAHQNSAKKKSVEEEPLSESYSPQDRIDSGISDSQDQVKNDLLEQLRNMDAYYFESLAGRLLEKMGYGVAKTTPKSRDGGIDGIISEDKLRLEKIYLQVKRYGTQDIGEKEIRDFIGAMSGDTQKGVFITTSEFSDAALKKAEKASHTIVLIDGRKLVDLMYDHNVGVMVKNTYEVKAVDEDSFETS